jgi:hypothetical protein
MNQVLIILVVAVAKPSKPPRRMVPGKDYL